MSKKIIKTILPALSCVMILASLLFAIAEWYLIASRLAVSVTDSGFYSSPAFNRLLKQSAWQLYDVYSNHVGDDGQEARAANVQEDILTLYTPTQTNFRFILLDETKNAEIANAAEENINGRAVYSFSADGNNITILCGVSDTLLVRDEFADSYARHMFLFEHRHYLRPLILVCTLLAIGFCFAWAILLFRENKLETTVAAGKKTMNLPIDFALMLLAAGALILMYSLRFLFRQLPDMNGYSMTALVLLAALVLWASLLCVTYLCVMQMVRKKVWVTLASVRCVQRLGEPLKRVAYPKKVLFLLIAMAVLNTIWLSGWFSPYWDIFFLPGLITPGYLIQLFAGVLLAFVNIALFYWVYQTAKQQASILKQMQSIAENPTAAFADTASLSGIFGETQKAMEEIKTSLKTALAEQRESERLKTDLIANVSHDIKTPLTSIVNYTELLRRNGGKQPQQEEYLNVLTKQSMRLKKLTEDIIDASRFSTGDVQMKPSEMSVSELLEQAIGEYQYRLADKQLVCVMDLACDANVQADGDFLWRIFDNLMGNIHKYSQPGTRVYLSTIAAALQQDESPTIPAVAISLRNISAQPLNISSAELMQRFVRGDVSRHTEGSGLGLSIAESLVKLQGGLFEIEIDGDLFKATVILPTADT